MKLCIPVTDTTGIDAAIEGHFPHAETLLVFDTETRAIHHLIVNSPEPQSDEATLIHAVLCGSINRHTLRSLVDQGIEVYGTAAATAAEAIAQFEKGELVSVSVAGRQGHHHGAGGCGGHGDGHGHRHGHEAEHECCGGKGHADKDHECCGGKGHGDAEHECCGGGNCQ